VWSHDVLLGVLLPYLAACRNSPEGLFKIIYILIT
jgi:hypothetical protein